jgi:hypothetical protein
MCRSSLEAKRMDREVLLLRLAQAEQERAKILDEISEAS